MLKLMGGEVRLEIILLEPFKQHQQLGFCSDKILYTHNHAVADSGSAASCCAQQTYHLDDPLSSLSEQRRPLVAILRRAGVIIYLQLWSKTTCFNL